MSYGWRRLVLGHYIGVEQVHHLVMSGVGAQSCIDGQLHEAGVAVIEFIVKMQANADKGLIGYVFFAKDGAYGFSDQAGVGIKV